MVLRRPRKEDPWTELIQREKSLLFSRTYDPHVKWPLVITQFDVVRVFDLSGKGIVITNL